MYQPGELDMRNQGPSTYIESAYINEAPSTPTQDESPYIEQSGGPKMSTTEESQYLETVDNLYYS